MMINHGISRRKNISEPKCSFWNSKYGLRTVFFLGMILVAPGIMFCLWMWIVMMAMLSAFFVYGPS